MCDRLLAAISTEEQRLRHLLLEQLRTRRHRGVLRQGGKDHLTSCASAINTLLQLRTEHVIDDNRGTPARQGIVGRLQEQLQSRTQTCTNRGCSVRKVRITGAFLAESAASVNNKLNVTGGLIEHLTVDPTVVDPTQIQRFVVVLLTQTQTGDATENVEIKLWPPKGAADDPLTMSRPLPEGAARGEFGFAIFAVRTNVWRHFEGRWMIEASAGGGNTVSLPLNVHHHDSRPAAALEGSNVLGPPTTNRDTFLGAKHIINVFGVVHPQSGAWALNEPWTVTAEDGSSVQIMLTLSQYSMRITTEGPDDIHAAIKDGSAQTWVNEVIYGHQPLLRGVLDSLGLHLGARLDPEMTSGTIEGVGTINSMPFMAAFETLSGPPLVGGETLVPTAMMAITNPFARSALADVSNALRFDEDSPFFCYRTLESMRKHYAAITGARSDKKSWEALRADLGIDHSEIDALKEFADTRRHGGAGTSLHADHLHWTQWTRKVLERFLNKHWAAATQKNDAAQEANSGSPGE
jgi:hypothetical protein